MVLSNALRGEVTRAAVGIRIALEIQVKRKEKARLASHFVRRFTRICLLVGLALYGAGLIATAGLVEQGQAQATDPAVAAFTERVKEYIKLRKKAEGKPRKLSDKSKPEEIEAHLSALQASISTARVGAKPGDIFTPDIARYIRRAIRNEFRGERLKNLRATIREAETKGVAMRANVPYPETKELIEMPPALLLNLPVLPEDLHYRFVGGYLLLVDKEARLILDYMAGAIPRPTTPAR